MDSKAQVSVDYLLTITFAIALTLAAVVVIVILSNMANDAQSKVLNAREETISSIISS